MKKLLFCSLCVMALLVAGCANREIGAMKFPAGKVQHAVRATEIKWRPCPKSLPAGCRISVLEGHPKKPDLFTIRFKIDKDLFMRPHTHPRDERVTILSGKAAVAFGKNADRSQAKEFGPGDYYVNARNAVHSVWIEENTILQITGIGPWQAKFIKKAK